ncbi:MAG: hypothetical protein HY060_07525 [Proteobacteria bacterium]|nr:hypothetical protein [Pseudomonadota bacterium]
MNSLAHAGSDPCIAWAPTPDDLILIVGATPPDRPTALRGDALETVATAFDLTVGDRSVALRIARSGRRGETARRLAGPTVPAALAELARPDAPIGALVLETDAAPLAALLDALGTARAPAVIAIARATAGTGGRWDPPLFDAGYVRVRAGACALVTDAADAYVRSALLTDLSLLREPSSNAVSMQSLGNNGRFANQLWQYAFLHLYGLRNNCRVQTPRWIGQMLYGLAAEPPNPSFSCQSFTLFTGVERHLWTMAEPPRNIDFWGYFQEVPESWRHHRALLRRLFTPQAMFVELIDRWIKRVVPPDATLVGIHVRRGDYPLFNHESMPWFRPIPFEWYDALLRELWPTLDRPVLFIATDDAAAVAPQFADYDPLIAPAAELALPELGFLPDFHIMQRCAILAASNSSYSRMAALLATGDQVTYLPNMAAQRFERYEPWFDDNFWARFEA